MQSTRRFLADYSEDELQAKQLKGLQWTVAHAYNGNPTYRQKLEEAGIGPDTVKNLDDIRRLPFTSVEDLRAGYPLPLLCVPEDQVVRIHSSSGTTGKRKILCYTQRDIDTWKHMFARCYELAGLTTKDRVQIAVGYGLWTAGAGFQLGCEHFGAMAVPVGPGHLDIHIKMLTDLKPTCLCSTASMALLLGEELEKRGIKDQINLKTCIFGAETHSARMRRNFERKLGLEQSFDITGMTELYGPGSGLECQAHEGIHYWADYYILEILDPITLEPVAPGEVGEMVVTSLCKEAAPLIRYRTRDLTRLLPGDCPCGLKLPRHDKIMGRSDDMIIYRGVNIYPSQIGEVLEGFRELSSEFQIHLTRSQGLDVLRLKVEHKPDNVPPSVPDLEKVISRSLQKQLLARCEVEVLAPGALPRTMGKSKRVQDERNGD